MRQVVHIKAAGSHVGGHEQLGQVLAELLHGQVTLLLAQVTMQRLGIISVLDQFVGYLLRFQLGTAEDDGKNLRIVVNDTFQGQIFVLRVYHIIYMIHILGSLVARTDNDFLRVVQILLGHPLHFAAHRGRKHQRVVLIGQRLEDFVDCVRETHVEHLVGFVEHYIAYILQLGKATVLQVYQTARGGHDDLHPLLQRANLRLDGGATIDSLHMDTLHVFREVTQVVGYLQTEFACR